MYEHPSEQTAIHTVFLLRVLLHNPGVVSKGGITLRFKVLAARRAFMLGRS
jgi:hypothetical protein